MTTEEQIAALVAEWGPAEAEHEQPADGAVAQAATPRHRAGALDGASVPSSVLYRNDVGTTVRLVVDASRGKPPQPLAGEVLDLWSSQLI